MKRGKRNSEGGKREKKGCEGRVQGRREVKKGEKGKDSATGRGMRER